MARGYWPALLSALILWSHSLRRLINQGVICISILTQIVVTHIQRPPPFTILIGPPGSPQKNKYIPLLPGTKSNENESFPPPPAVQLWVRLLPAGIGSSRLYWLIRAWLMTIKDSSISFLIRCGYKGRKKVALKQVKDYISSGRWNIRSWCTAKEQQLGGIYRILFSGI